MTRQLHAEWTKFRTVPAWRNGMVLAGLMIVLVAALAGLSSDQKGSPPVPIGPNGEPVTDSFYFAHQPLTGDGSITVAVDALSSSIPTAPGNLRPGIVPWAKAGLIVRQSLRPGSPYAAIMLTGTHGVRMQDNFVDDRPGPSTAAFRRLRLDRSGNTVTGSASTDGKRWATVGSVRLSGLKATVQGGLFVASPPHVDGKGTRGSVSTARFSNLHTTMIEDGESLVAQQLGLESPTFAGYPDNTAGSITRSGPGYTMTGAGDLAPAIRESLPTGGTVGDILTGAFAALIAMIVVGALYVTTEYRAALIRVTLAATPGRARLLVAKAMVLGGVTFVAGLVGTVVAIPMGLRLARANGVYVFPTEASTEVRVALGTAALLAAASILALSAGVILRSSSVAVTFAALAVVLPYLLIANPFMPPAAAGWLARLTPAAGFAVLNTLVEYPQVDGLYSPYDGYYPLSPWAGLAVLAGYALAALALASIVLRRRDA